jgi:hypothetical protein
VFCLKNKEEFNMDTVRVLKQMENSMQFMKMIIIWFLVIMWGATAACTVQESTSIGSESATVETAQPPSNGIAIIEAETAEPTATATLTTPTPTATAVLPTPTATATEAPPTVEPTSTPLPVALCPGEAESELTWSCEENSRDGVRYCTAVELEQQFVCYEDLTHSFALSLAAEWTTFVTVYQRPPHRETNQIVIDHDVSFYSNNQLDGGVKLSVFVPREQSLANWLTNKHRVSPDVYPITNPNARVAGHPAAVWKFDCSPQWYREVQVAVHNGERVFLWRHYAFNEAGVLALRPLLDSMRFSEETAVPAEIPDELWQEALDGCRIMTPKYWEGSN